MVLPAAGLPPLLNDVKLELTPTTSQQAQVARAAARLLERARKLIEAGAAPETKPEPVMVGSVAKGTYLWPCDLDLFLCYPSQTPLERLEREGLELGAKLVEEPRRLYASHPYTRGSYQRLEVDVVPCYRLAPGEPVRTAVDRTPLHTAHVKANLPPAVRAEVRLLKALCQGLGVYGAEASVGGFSGYLCELLILAYGSLEGLLEQMVEWRPPLRIDWEGGGQAKPGPYGRHQKGQGPLWVTDPVDPKRNAAAAVGDYGLATLVLGARELLARPHRHLFFPPGRDPLPADRLAQLTAERTSWVGVVELARPEGLAEVVGPQLVSLRHQLWERLAEAGFGPLGLVTRLLPTGLVLAMELERGHLPASQLHLGPHGWRESTLDFQRQWEGRGLSRVHLHRGRLVVQRLRRDPSWPQWVRNNLSRVSVAQPLKGVLQAEMRVKLWAPGQPPACPAPGLLTRLLDPGLPWEGRIVED